MSEKLTSDAKFKGGADTFDSKIDDILIECFTKSTFGQKVHDEQNIKLK